MRAALPLLLAFLCGTAQAAAIERFKTFVKTTQSARADFEQNVVDRTGKPVQKANGTFVFQRPGKFRWVYAKPADQVIVGDGERVWIHDRDLNQVTVRKLSKALGSTPAALPSASTYLAKVSELSEAGARDKLEWLEAKPRDPEAGFDRIRMGFSATAIAALEVGANFCPTT